MPSSTVKMTMETMAGTSWRRITSTPRAVMMMSMSLMPMNGRDHPAGAVDQEVAAQQVYRVVGTNFTPRSASGISPTMMSALKMTAERIAERGVCRSMTLRSFEHADAGEPGEHRGDDREVLGDVVGDRERRERSAGDEQLLADLDDVDELRRVGVEVDHVAGFLRRLRAGVHRDTDVGLRQRGASLVPSPVIATRRPPRCSWLDQLHLVFGGGFGEEVVDARFLRDDRGGPWVVAGDHHGADPHAAEVVEALGDAGLTMSLR